MRTLDLESLLIFKTVVECGGISRAALQLNRVQSNVTMRVKSLEERLGVMLFIRQGGRLTLSADGRLLLTYAQRLLRLAAEAEAALTERAPRGALRLGTLESTAAARLSPLLSSFHRNYPDVQLELATGSSSKLLDLVRQFEVDAAFVSQPFHAPELSIQLAFQEELVIIAHKRAANVMQKDHLRAATLIAFEVGCSYRKILENWLNFEGVNPRRILELASYHAIVACVAGGSGIAVMPRAVFRAVHAENELQVLALPLEFSRVCTYLVWHPAQSSAALDALRLELECLIPSAQQHQNEKTAELVKKVNFS